MEKKENDELLVPVDEDESFVKIDIDKDDGAEKEFLKRVKRPYNLLTQEEKKAILGNSAKFRKRVFNLMQYREHPRTGEKLLSENMIKNALKQFKNLEYAYILHDKDTYKDGKIKPAHWHIVIRTKNAISLGTVCERFEIYPNFVEMPIGKDAFGDCLEYLTHESDKEQEQGKYLYSDEAIKSNCDWRKIVMETLERRLKRRESGSVLDDIYEDSDEIRRETLYFRGVRDGNITLADVEAEEPDLFFKKIRDFRYFRGIHLTEKAEMPKLRLNFYIYGGGGAGKDVMSIALAKALCPEITDERKLYFMVGDSKVPFDGYDGQPVIIWSDFRAYELMKTFKTRGMVFKAFDTRPKPFSINVKYAKVNLINKYNIVNSVQDYYEFLNELSGGFKMMNGKIVEGEDKKQSYRRFPMIIPIRTTDFDVMINKGFVGDGSYFEYKEIKGVIGNFSKIARIADESQKQQIEKQTLSIPLKEVEKIESTLEQGKERVIEEFAMFGKTFDEQAVIKSIVEEKAEDLLELESLMSNLEPTPKQLRRIEKLKESIVAWNERNENFNRYLSKYYLDKEKELFNVEAEKEEKKEK